MDEIIPEVPDEVLAALDPADPDIQAVVSELLALRVEVALLRGRLTESD